MQSMRVINAPRFDSTIIFRFVILLFHISFDDNIYRAFESMTTVLMQKFSKFMRSSNESSADKKRS